MRDEQDDALGLFVFVIAALLIGSAWSMVKVHAKGQELDARIHRECMVHSERQATFSCKRVMR